jgi:hypothetical protein
MINPLPSLSKFNWLLCTTMGIVLMLSACAGGPKAAEAQSRQATAIAMWKERCKTAGEKIYKTVDDVEGIFVMKLRPSEINFDNQFTLNDPYGRDGYGNGYIGSFLRDESPVPFACAAGAPPSVGYRSVEANDPVTGQRYRYVGRVEEPWQTNKKYLKGYFRFVMDQLPASGPAPRYGVTYDDISTHEEREYWIAGSSLKVVDLQTNEVIAERIGYMIDVEQGSTRGQRSPWLSAADYACPSFIRNPNVRKNWAVPNFSAQLHQSQDFVEKVLKPAP